MELLEKYDYPGNIRELENLVERLVVLDKKGKILVNDLPEYIRQTSTEANLDDVNFDLGLSRLVDNYEKGILMKALEMNNFNKVQTAKMLKVSRGTLMSKLKKYGVS